MRADDYLIIRFPTAYAAHVGLPGARELIGNYPDAEAAQRACEAHRQKEAEAP
jgi:hypothetical protein